MKRFATLILLISLSINALHGQTYLFKENFEKYTSYKITAWNTTQHTGPNAWEAGLMYMVTGSDTNTCLGNTAPRNISYKHMAGIGDCVGKPGFNINNSNVLMYTKPIDFTGHNRIWIKHDSYFLKHTDGIHTEKATVEISIDGGNNWTVLENMIANPDANDMATYMLDISVYKSFSDVRIGFRYSDNGGSLTGWAVDNVEIFEPADTDLKLIAVSPFDTAGNYGVINKGTVHTFKLYNAGVDTIHNCVLYYKLDNGDIKTDSLKGIDVPTFTEKAIAHKIPDTITSFGNHIVKAWVTTAGDNIHYNDSANVVVRGASFIPNKLVLLEQGTGTWNFWSPRGFVLSKQIDSAGLNVCQLAVHDVDPMALQDYSDYIYNLRQAFVTYNLLDRHINEEPGVLLSTIKTMQQQFGYANIGIEAKIDGDSLRIDSYVQPAIDLTGDFRLILAITEDDVKGEGQGWDQKNGYAWPGAVPFGGYENKPIVIPAKDIAYQYVVRAMLPSFDGQPNLPQTLVHDQVYPINFSTALTLGWNRNRLRANVFLFRNDDSTVLNSNKVLFYLPVNKIEDPYASAFVYPNPGNEISILQFYNDGREKMHICIMDISGKMVADVANDYFETGKNEVRLNTNELMPGMYFVNITSAKGRKSLKLQVIH
ncbi:MAG: T9SS type A sorting domain-containing protein [Bacteroidetes bacterium]|nr:T9SS type A sorting domain-containing protein [Bacteroidota bacterium]